MEAHLHRVASLATSLNIFWGFVFKDLMSLMVAIFPFVIALALFYCACLDGWDEWVLRINK